MRVLRFFDFLSAKLLKRYPNYETYLEEAGINEDPVYFVDKAIFYSLLSSFFSFFAIYFSLISISFEHSFLVSLLLSIFNGITVFLYFFELPFIVLMKEVYETNKVLPYILRLLYVQVNSGLPIFDAISYVAYKMNNPISRDFREIIKETESGVPLDVVIKRKSSSVRSKNYSQFLLQLSDAIKVGTDISKVLKSLIDEFVEEEKINIKWFRSKVNVILSLYLIVALAFPAITLVIINLLNLFSTFYVTYLHYVFLFVILAFLQYSIVAIVDYYKKKVLT